MGDRSLPTDQTLAEVARAIDEAGMVAHIMDPDSHVVWLSREFRAMIGEEDPERLGYRQIVELDDAPPKAVRDAGALPIVTV